MKKVLIRFWINTPAGKFEFNRNSDNTWTMSHTLRRVPNQTVNAERNGPVTAADILREFNWPVNSFNTYGHRFEEEVKKTEPTAWHIVITKEPPKIAAIHYCIHREGSILYFKNREDLSEYCEQLKGEN